jgi:hypothetical protein
MQCIYGIGNNFIMNRTRPYLNRFVKQKEL